MKNLLKIGALSLALIAAVFMLNKTNAQTAQLDLEIYGTSGHCTYGNLVDFGSYARQTAAVTRSTGFLTTGGAAEWYCDDQEGKSSFAMTIQSSEVVNASNSGWNIPASRVFINNSGATVVSWACTANAGTSNGTDIPLSGSVTILGKTSAISEICKVQTPSVTMKIAQIANQAVGTYSGTLTLSVPLP